MSDNTPTWLVYLILYWYICRKKESVWIFKVFRK